MRWEEDRWRKLWIVCDFVYCFVFQVTSDGRWTVCCGQEVVLGAGRIWHGSGDLGGRTVRDLLQGKKKKKRNTPPHTEWVGPSMFHLCYYWILFIMLNLMSTLSRDHGFLWCKSSSFVKNMSNIWICWISHTLHYLYFLKMSAVYSISLSTLFAW